MCFCYVYITIELVSLFFILFDFLCLNILDGALGFKICSVKVFECFRGVFRQKEVENRF
jgi:hypothetical protein